MESRKHNLLVLILIAAASLMQAQHPFFKQYTRTEGLPGNSVFDLMTDSRGMLWLATNKGVAYYQKGTFVIPDQPPSLRSSNVLNIFEAPDGSMWVNTASGELFRGDRQKGFTAYKLPSGLHETTENRILNALSFDEKGNIYLSTVIGGGFFRLHNGNFSLREFNEQPTSSYFLAEISQGNFIWGSQGSFPPNNLLYVTLRDQLPFIVQLSSESGFSKSSFLSLRNGSMLFAKDYEIIHFDGNEVNQRGFLPQKVEALFESSDERIWVGLNRGGVVCYLTENLSLEASTRYLGSKSITSIAEDGEGNTWFGSLDEGVFSLPGKPQISYSTPKILITEENTEPLLTPVPLSPLPASDSLRLPPENKVSREKPAPTVFISHLEINGSDTAVGDFYLLDHDQNFISMNFAGFVDNHPAQLQYRYMMKGYDEDWTYTNTPHAQYSHLRPDEYVFLVYAMDNRGIWSESPAKITFFISQPFWNTWLFYAILIIAFLLFAVLVLFWGLKRSREKALMNKQSLLSELKVLRAQMNPHFTFNTLSSIQHFIGNNNNEEAISYLSKFAKLMRSIMENTKKPTIPVKDEIGALQLYMELERLRLNGKFDFEIKVDPEIDGQYDQIPSLLIQPYVENAIWHGFKNKKDRGRIVVELKRKDNFIICIIEDNGIGREASRKMNGAQHQHKSMGMEITKERLEIINRLNNSPLSVNIIDLKAASGDASGTKVEIFIPLEE